jgi:hypothetical protein
MAGVRTTHAEYDAFAPKWKRTRDCISGQDAMHAAGDGLSPQAQGRERRHRLQGAQDAARLKLSDFFNGTYRTIDALGGMAFRKPPSVDVPKAIEPISTM